jgi:hypothetical protein
VIRGETFQRKFFAADATKGLPIRRKTKSSSVENAGRSVRIGSYLVHVANPTVPIAKVITNE